MSENKSKIIGAGGGGKKKGGKGRVAVQTPQRSKSTQYVEIVEVVSEGAIWGLATKEDKPLRSIYYDGTPLQNANGTYNFHGAVIDARNGYADQEPLENIRGASVVQPINVEVSSNIPITRSINLVDANAITVTISIPRLLIQDKTNGDMNRNTVAYKIEIQKDGGGFVTKYNGSFTDAIYSRYQREHYFEYSGGGTYDIRVTKLTADSTDEAVQNDIYLDSIAGIVNEEFAYPNCAVVGTVIDAEQFSQIPTRGYDLKGLVIKIPKNFNPETRTYDGVWDGTFKLGWTDDPAWIMYDLLTNERYGMGDYIAPESVDKWELYQISQHCNQLVPDGYGGLEPRFTCSVYLQSKEEAFDVVRNLASAFRAMTYWGAGAISFSQDRPFTAHANFSNADVIDGQFVYQGADSRQIHNVAYVSWNDPDDLYQLKTEYIQLDDSDIVKNGINQLEMSAFGCTSRGQAHRIGKWALLTEKYSETVTFRIALNKQSVLYPGMVIKVSDLYRSGFHIGGRVTSATLETINFDHQEVRIQVGSIISVHLPNGETEQRSVSSFTDSSLQVSSAFSAIPPVGSSFSITSGDLVPEEWKVVNIVEEEGSESSSPIVAITAVYHNPNKYDEIEQNLKFDPRPVSLINAVPKAPSDLDFKVVTKVLDGNVIGLRGIVSWFSDDSSRFRVAYRAGAGDFWKVEYVDGHRIYEIEDVIEGVDYQIRVTAISPIGVESPVAEFNKAAQYIPRVLPDVQNLRLDGEYTTSNLRIVWDRVRGADNYIVQIYANNQLVKTKHLGDVLSFSYSAEEQRQDGGAWRNVELRVKATGMLQAESENWAEIIAHNPQIGQLQGVRVTGGVKSILFNCIEPREDDFSGYLLWVSTDPNFVPTSGNAVKDVRFGQIFVNEYEGEPLEAETEYYVWWAGYDDFGKDSLNIGGSLVVQVVSLDISPNSITEDMIQDGAFTLTKFADGIKVPLVVAELPTTGNIGDLVVLQSTGVMYRWTTTGWVAQQTIIEDGSITTPKLAVGAVGADQIASNSITAKHLVIRGNNLIPNSDFYSADYSNWRPFFARNNGNYVTSRTAEGNVPHANNSPTINFACFEFGADWVYPNAQSTFAFSQAYTDANATQEIIKVKAGEIYYVSIDLCNIGALAGTGDNFSVLFIYHKVDGSLITGSSTAIARPMTSNFDWTTIENKVTVPNNPEIAYVSVYVYWRLTNAPSGLVRALWTNLKVIRAADSTTIANGAIKTQHMVANTINGNVIAANTMHGDKIVANTINADKLVANSVTAEKLAADSVTADKINVSTLSAISADMGSITGGQLSIGGGRFNVDGSGNVNIKSADAGQRMVITNGLIQVYDSNNVLRVRLGIW